MPVRADNLGAGERLSSALRIGFFAVQAKGSPSSRIGALAFRIESSAALRLEEIFGVDLQHF